MKTKFRRALSFLAVSPLVIAASCSTDAKKRGQIMIAVTSDLSVPANMDEVVVEVLDEDGFKQSVYYPINPNPGGKPLPGTVAVVPPNSGGQRLRVRVIGQLNKGKAEARVLREALVMVPRDRVGMLHMPIRWLCDGELDQDPETGAVTSRCESDTLTCKAGGCENADLTAVELPEYEPAAVYGGGNEDGKGGTCFDATACFDKGVAVPLDMTSCTVPLPTGGEGVSVAVVPTDPRKGICPPRGVADGTTGGNEPPAEQASGGTASGDCYIPIDRDDEDGWKEVGGRIQLPSALCRARSAQVSRVVVTTACATKTIASPICGPWSNVAAKTPAGAQTPPVVGSGDDDAGVEPRADASTGTGGAGNLPMDAGRAGASGFDDGGVCFGEQQVLQPLADGAMFIVVDGSAHGAPTMALVPPLLAGWASSAASVAPNVGVGLGLSMNTCGEPFANVASIRALSSGLQFPVGEFAMGDFPLDAALPDAHRELLAWNRGAPTPLAIVVISAQGPIDCAGPNLLESVGQILTADGVRTHVLSPGPGSSTLDNLATAGGTGGVITFSDGPGLHLALNNIATGLAQACTFAAPLGGPGVDTVSLNIEGDPPVTLPFHSDVVACADGRQGYAPHPSGNPGFIQLCPATCDQIQAATGTAQVVATQGCGGGGGQGGAGAVPVGAGGGTAGLGGATGTGGAVSPPAPPGPGGSPGTVDAGPGACPTGEPPPGAQCGPAGLGCDYGATTCTCVASQPFPVWQCQAF